MVRKRRLAEASKRNLDEEIIRGRYDWIDTHAAHFLREPRTPPTTLTDRVDRVLLHPAAGFLVFLATMGLVFQSLFSWADPAISLVESAFGAVQGWVRELLPAGLLTDLLRRTTDLPAGFHLHPKLKRWMDTRLQMAAGERPLDWAAGEALAFATLSMGGVPLRMTGQDCSRGTFSHRHAVITDVKTGREHLVLGGLHSEAGDAAEVSVGGRSRVLVAD